MFQPALDLFLVDEPVAERGTVVIAVPEPAVVHYQHLDTGFFRFSCNVEELFGVEVEVCGFPVVYQYRTAHVLPLAADKVVTHHVVEVPGHLAQTFRRVGYYDFRSLKALAGFEMPAEVIGVDAHYNAGLFVLIDLRHCKE